MVLLAILLIIVILRLFLRISSSIGKVIAIFIDFLILGGFAMNFFHHKISTVIASGKAVYFWNIVFTVIICALYFFLLVAIFTFAPKVGAIINYFIAWIGTFIIYFLVFAILNNDELPQLLDNENLSKLTNLIIVSLLAIITFQARQNIFNVHELAEK